MSTKVGWADDSGSESSDDEQQEEQLEQQQQSQQQQTKEESKDTQNQSSNSNSNEDNFEVPNSPYVIYVGNLSYSVSENELGSFFVDGGCNVHDVHIYTYNNKSIGCSVVIFEDEESFIKSKDADGYEIKNRPISIKSTLEEVKRGISTGGKKERGGGGYNSRSQSGRGGTGGRGKDGRGHKDRYHDREGAPGRDRDRDRDGGRDQNRNRDDRRSSSGRGNGGRDYRENRENREGREGRGRGDHKQAASTTTTNATTTTPGASELPAVRPKLHLDPRTLPVEKVGEVVGSPSGLFGSGKPRDELEYVSHYF